MSDSIFALIRLATAPTRASDLCRKMAFQIRIPLKVLLYLPIKKNPSPTLLLPSLQGKKKMKKQILSIKIVLSPLSTNEK